MLQFSPSALLAGIEAGLRGLEPDVAGDVPARRLCIAYSGGLDSTVLLHAAARLCADHPGHRLRAVHIDHQLHDDSARWSTHCEAFAGRLGAAFQKVTVEVPRRPDQGLEAAARAARYDALGALLAPGELLLTAHHADDQLETVLLALMRGAGLRGLSAMPSGQRFARGWLVRPLLGFTRTALEAWACQERLEWLTDPSNTDTRFDRNYLRHRVLPALQERWPAAARSAVRSAAHLGEAGAVLDALAARDYAAAGVGACVALEALRSLDPARRRNLLRYWIRQQGLLAPSTRKLAAIEHDLLRAREDRVPCVAWEGGELRRHAGLIHALRPGEVPAAAFEPLRWPVRWPATQPLVLPGGLGRLRLEHCGSRENGGHETVMAEIGMSGPGLVGPPVTGPPVTGPPITGLAVTRLAPSLEVRARRGGEFLRPAGDPHRRTLKKLLQSRGVLPWWRPHVPLIYSAGRLAAVADLWIAQEFAAGEGEPSARIVWEAGPDLLSSTGRLG
ncbi:hypothetical protein ACG33_09530 [Steroidobacter denitrificans]|uniref:tRNA(Ile)-lysidine synthase n=1 Tax=Steroidobacter denitrificans TaxID=465721 RepID=A0A127FCI1_STEDE|nr:tRNA lysidine(34) synthetase TilS [Steroidobacter denitrificans]AMN47331.1 hypothetical protein ACG33_09530 [Steroidobacter denitrificans]